MRNPAPAARRPLPADLSLKLTLLLAFAAGCGARPATPPPPPVEIEMEPMVVEVSAEDGSFAVFDAAALFGEGKAAFESQDFATCDAAYGKLLDRFPDSHFVHATLYNRGLCLEHLRFHDRAGAHFKRYAQISEELRDQRDGQFRWGFNLVRSGDFTTAYVLYTRLIGSDDIRGGDRAECHLRRGTALSRLGRVGEAEADFKLAISLAREAFGGVVEGSELVAETHFRRGELYQKLAHAVHLKLPVDSMKGDLRDKTRFFRQAQTAYIESLRVRHSYWATAAGMRLGELYEQFYMDVLQAETPPDFDLTTRRFYLVELKKALQPVLEQSLTIYEKNITLSERLGADNEWVAQTEERLEKLRGLLEENEREAKAVEAEYGEGEGAGPPPTPKGAPKPAPRTAPGPSAQPLRRGGAG